MKIFIICSKAFYDQVAPIKEQLKAAGHIVALPLSFENPKAELEAKQLGAAEHINWKAGKLRETIAKIETNDAVMVLNFAKNGIPNYIGGATFLEVFKAWEIGKPVYFYNPLPDGILHDELLGMNPTVIHGKLDLIKENP